MYFKNHQKQLLHFKKWSRKSYAVFNTLHREVKIGVLSLAAFTTLGAHHVVAQNVTEETNREVDLDEVVISAEAAPELQSEIARVVTIIRKDEIQASPVNSVADLLEFALNIDVRQRGTNGVQSDISIRGGSFDQVMVLLNGMNISDPQTGHNLINLLINLNSIDRIEILNGPGSRHLGANAYSGAINIITNSKENLIKAQAVGGEHEFFNGSLSLGFNNNITSHFISAGTKSSDGYINNTDFDKNNIFYQGSLSLNFGEFEWQGGITENAFGANSFYTPVYPNQFEEVRTSVAGIKFTTGNKFKVSPSFYYRGGNDRFELFRAQPDVFPYNFHQSKVYGGKLNATWYNTVGKTSFGLELRNENSLSTNLGNTPDSVAVKGYDAFYKTSYGRINYSAFAEQNLRFAGFSFTIGLMAFSSDVLDEVGLYPGLDASYEIFDGLRFKAAANRSLRMPTFTDLFYAGPSNIGNPDLKPETAWTYEGGLKYHSEDVSSHITMFYRQGSNLIDWVKPAGSDEKYTTTNYTTLNTLGLETFVKYQPNKRYLKRVSLSYAYLNSDKLQQDFDSRYALDYLKHNLSLTYNHTVFSSISAEWNLLWQDRAGSYSKYLGKDDEGVLIYETTEYNPFWLCNVKVYWQNKYGQVFAEASNLFNTTYIDVANVPQPGRWIKGGVVLEIKY